MKWPLDPGTSLVEEKRPGNMVPAATGDYLRQGAAPGLYPARAGDHQAAEAMALRATTSRSRRVISFARRLSRDLLLRPV